MKQFNNKSLVIVLVVLAGIFLIAKVYRTPKRESNLKDAIVSVDTSKVTEISIVDASDKKGEIKLDRDENRWVVHNENKTAPVHMQAVKSLMESIATLSAQKLVTRKKEKWDEYGVSDSTATHLVVFEQGKTVADWWVGKNAGGITYIRVAEEDEVYGIDGMLKTVISKDYNEWRDKTFLAIDKNSVISIAFSYLGDSSFVLEKKNNSWKTGAEEVDSTKVENYLNTISSKSLSSFADNFEASGRQPDAYIHIKNNDNSSVTINGWRRENDWVLTSSYQKGVYFSSEGSSIDKDLFAGRNNFR